MRGVRKPRVAIPSQFGCVTRRGLLQRAGWAATAAALPWPNSLAGESVSPVMTRLSSYMSEARSQVLPDEVVEKAKQHILDTFAAMVSGSELTPGRAALQFARSYGADKVSTIVCSNILCGPMEAALVNGLLAHSDETDDAHSPSLSHPGVAVVPAALAVGEKFGIDGPQFLRAVVLGYDIGPRFVTAMGGPAIQTEDHRSTHTLAGIFGAAAAAGCCASLNPQQIRWLIDYTAQQSSGFAAWQRDTEHIEKGFVYAGMPARGGVTSALLVQSGWTGVDDVLSGSDNFFQAYGLHADTAKLVEKLGERFEVTQTDIKKWTVAAAIQAPLDALDILLKRHPFDAEQVQEATVRMGATHASHVNNREMPDICLQHMVAVMMLDKTVSFKAAHDKPRMQDPDVLRVREKVRLVSDVELERLEPRRVAIVKIILKDGSLLTERIDSVRGTPANPMTREEVRAKARDLMTSVLGEEKTANLTEKVLSLESITNILELRPFLQQA